MKLTKNNILHSLLLLMLLSNSSSAQESCKGGFCMISLDSLNNEKSIKIKKVKPSTMASTKTKETSKKR